MSSPYTHVFTVHFEVREKRGVGIRAIYHGVNYRGSSYDFPASESGIQEIRIPAGGVGATDGVVEGYDDLPCSVGLNGVGRIRSGDGVIEDITKTVRCTTRDWAL